MAVQKTQLALDQFTSALDRIVRANTNGSADGAAIVAEATPHFERMIADMSWLDEKFQEPAEHGIANYMIAKAPDNAWTVVSTVWWPDYSTPVHDHLVWGMIGVWQGTELERRYQRMDDRSRSGYADMRESGLGHNQPGDISPLVPPDDDYHLIKNDTDKPSFSIHVYGGSLDGILRHSYDLDTGEIKDFRSRYNIAC